MKKLPIGVQDYREIVEENYVYVDKTKYLYDLMTSGKFYFLSRPRRFGKSLTISTLYYIFKGEKELFRGTYIYDKWDFKEYPIIKLDMSDNTLSTYEKFLESLHNKFNELYSKHGLQATTDDLPTMFGNLITELNAKYRERVVILIDEYEAPILEHINNKKEAEKIRSFLREFYKKIKTKDEYIKFVFMTGITKFTKTGVFSALNNLNDISLNKKYSQMLGYTQEELEYYFKEHIEETAREIGMGKEELIENLKEYYNGFSFDGRRSVYNPFSILRFFEEREFKNYWFESGSPSFLYEYIKGRKVTYEELVKYPVSAMDFTTREIEDANANIFFAQAGYLTFKDVRRYGFEEEYILDYPNIEVRNSFSKLILEANYGVEKEKIKEVNREIIKSLEKNDIRRMIEEIKRIISSIPYNLHRGEERYYHSLIYTIIASAGVNVTAEELTSIGRSDIVIEERGKVYIFEIKIDKGAREGIRQIKEKRYYEKYVGKEIYLIGIKISSKERNIEEYVIEKVGG
ncbi:ATPase AAA [Thermosipho melanesiensis]|uniref:ATP-binding protein n=1 Tax=Thermosipho melanesiensis TaxID=46541 RepID=UPI000985E193|nr:ATP-binding protein [Thermosipho melanesiensis]OOC35961.1 ATPase AAA [Thermosipho melanesiensis]